MFERLETILNALNHAIIAITSCYLTWYCLYTGFNDATLDPTVFHGWFSATGYQLLMAEGILTMYSQNVFTSFSTRDGKTKVHWILQACGGGFALIGVLTQIISRIYLGKTHFGTTHSVFGLISTIFLLLTTISGCTALFSIELKDYVKPIFNKFFHDLLGLVTLICGLTTLIIAYETKSLLEKYDPGEMRTVMIWLISIVIILTLIGTIRTLWSHTETIILRRYVYQIF